MFLFQYPNIDVEWPVSQNMEEHGVDRIINELFYFMRREVLHQQGQFLDHAGALKEHPELYLYQNQNYMQ